MTLLHLLAVALWLRTVSDDIYESMYILKDRLKNQMEEDHNHLKKAELAELHNIFSANSDY